jgi:hypothetical protein
MAAHERAWRSLDSGWMRTEEKGDDAGTTLMG